MESIGQSITAAWIWNACNVFLHLQTPSARTILKQEKKSCKKIYYGSFNSKFKKVNDVSHWHLFKNYPTRKSLLRDFIYNLWCFGATCRMSFQFEPQYSVTCKFPNWIFIFLMQNVQEITVTHWTCPTIFLKCVTKFKLANHRFVGVNRWCTSTVSRCI